MKTFSKLGSPHVKIAGAGQQVHEVKRLSIAQLEQFEAIAEETFKKAEEHERDGLPVEPVFRDGSMRIVEVIHENFPEAIGRDLFRLRFPELLDIGLYLTYGEDQYQITPDSATPVKKKE